MSRPTLLDLYCKAGGAAVGYARAGFDVVGVDHEPQPNFPYGFIQADALEYVAEYGHLYDAIHASPECQGYSVTRHIRQHEYREYRMQIDDVRDALRATGKPYTIENVEGARRHMLHPVRLCGTMFGLRVYRHRLFESNMLLFEPDHPAHTEECVMVGRRPERGQYMTVAGHFSGIEYARECMGISWMNRAELAQAIPPAYTEHLGTQLMWHLPATLPTEVSA